MAGRYGDLDRVGRKTGVEGSLRLPELDVSYLMHSFGADRAFLADVRDAHSLHDKRRRRVTRGPRSGVLAS